MRRSTNFFLLLVVTLCFSVGSEGIVCAQAYQCTAFTAVPLTLRDDGLAELVGDLVLSCTGTLEHQPLPPIE